MSREIEKTNISDNEVFTALKLINPQSYVQFFWDTRYSLEISNDRFQCRCMLFALDHRRESN